MFIVIGLFTFSSARETRQANEKADEFIAALEDAGRPALPTKDQIVRVLGDDGGALCDDPGSALRKATLLLDADQRRGRARHAAGHRRQQRVVKGQLAVIEVYCPDELEDFKSYVSDLKYDDVVNG